MLQSTNWEAPSTLGHVFGHLKLLRAWYQPWGNFSRVRWWGLIRSPILGSVFKLIHLLPSFSNETYSHFSSWSNIRTFLQHSLISSIKLEKRVWVGHEPGEGEAGVHNSGQGLCCAVLGKRCQLWEVADCWFRVTLPTVPTTIGCNGILFQGSRLIYHLPMFSLYRCLVGISHLICPKQNSIPHFSLEKNPSVS